MGKYDSAGKKVINLYHQAWAEWVLQGEKGQVQAELSGEFQFFARRNDSLLKIVGNHGTFLALTELQFGYDSDMGERLAAYKLLARRQYKLPVFVTVIFFLPPPQGKTIPTRYEDEFMGQTSQVDYQLIKLWELDATTVLGYNNPMLVPFIPLMKGGGTVRMVRQCAERIRQEPAKTAAELESILPVMC